MENRKTVLITGASGVLGRALVHKFRSSPEWNVIGLAYTRAKDNLLKVNLLDKEVLTKVVLNTKPQVIIHTAAERNPNTVATNYEAAYHLNVNVSKYIAELADKVGAVLIYISTDYVFDGATPPYKETDTPNPLSKYGMTKLEGERVSIQAHPDAIILRIPLIYGKVEHLKENAVSYLLTNLLDKDKVYHISDYEIRYPTLVDDVAEVCKRLTTAALNQTEVRGIYHCSGRDAMTKYGIVKIMADKMQLPMDHILPDDQPTPGEVQRPFNSHLETSKLDALVGAPYTPFGEAIKSCLIDFVTNHA